MERQVLDYPPEQLAMALNLLHFKGGAQLLDDNDVRLDRDHDTGKGI